MHVPVLEERHRLRIITSIIFIKIIQYYVQQRVFTTSSTFIKTLKLQKKVSADFAMVAIPVEKAKCQQSGLDDRNDDNAVQL